MIPEFVVPKTCTHSPYNFGVSFFILLRSLECEAGLLILQGRHKFESMAVGYWLNFIEHDSTSEYVRLRDVMFCLSLKERRVFRFKGLAANRTPGSTGEII